MPITIKTGRFGTTIVTMPNGDVRKFDSREAAKDVARREGVHLLENVVDLDAPARKAMKSRLAPTRAQRALRPSRFQLFVEERPADEEERESGSDAYPHEIIIYALGKDAARWALDLDIEIDGTGFESCGRECAYMSLYTANDEERASIFNQMRRLNLQYTFADYGVPRGVESQFVGVRKAMLDKINTNRYRRERRRRGTL